MSIVDKLFKRNTTNADTQKPPSNEESTEKQTSAFQTFLMNLFNAETDSGESVTSENAIKTATVYSCVKILANHVAMLPCQIFQITEEGKRVRQKEHRVSKLIETRPNPYMTPFEFKQTMESHRQLYGNAYAEIEWGRDGYPKNLWILNPKLTKVMRDTKKNKIWVTTTLPNGQYVKLPYTSIIHLKGLSVNGLTGLSPIEVARQTIGSQMASQKYLNKFYNHGNTASGILKVPVQLNKEAKDKVRNEWEQYSRGLTNAHRVAILDAGIDYQAIGMTQADAQFIETQKFTVSEIAKIFNIPPHMLGELEKATFSNIEQQSMEFVRDTLTPLLVSWEQTLQYQLLSTEDIKAGYYIKYNLNSILRGDSSSRATYYEKMIQLGIYSINEVRELEEKDSIENGDKHFVSLNYVSLEKMDEYQLNKAKGGGNSG